MKTELPSSAMVVTLSLLTPLCVKTTPTALVDGIRSSRKKDNIAFDNFSVQVGLQRHSNFFRKIEVFSLLTKNAHEKKLEKKDTNAITIFRD